MYLTFSIFSVKTGKIEELKLGKWTNYLSKVVRILLVFINAFLILLIFFTVISDKKIKYQPSQLLKFVEDNLITTSRSNSVIVQS